MVATTTSGKEAMNGKPLTGVQRRKEYVLVASTGKWHYPNQYMLKVYTVLYDYGDMSFEDVKIKAHIPECWPDVYQTVREDMMQAGVLKTKAEATEDRKIAAQKKLEAEAEAVRLKGEAKIQPKSELVGPEKDAPVIQSTGLRTGTVMEAAINNATEDAPRGGKKPSPEAMRVRKNLAGLTLSQLKVLSHDDYMRSKAHYSVPYHVFHSSKKATIKLYEAKAQPPTPPQEQVKPPEATIPDSERQQGIKIILTLPIDDVEPGFRKLLKSKVELVFKEMAKESEKITIVTLDDPAALEVRKVVYF